MGHWMSSREFASLYNCGYEALKKACIRADQAGKKICKISNHILHFNYSQGIGRGGKVLRIWSEPFASEAEALEFSLTHTFEGALDQRQLSEVKQVYTEVLDQPLNAQAFTPSSDSIHLGNTQINNASDDRKPDDGVSALSLEPREALAPTLFSLSSAKHQAIALEKQSIIKEWERHRARGINAKDFITLTNAKGEYSLTLSENKLYAWQRAYKANGLDGLVESRGKKNGSSKIKDLNLEELTNKLILASRGRVNVSSIHRMLHIYLDSLGKIDLVDFLAKRDELISYSVLERYVKQYLKTHPLQAKIIARGEDAAVGNFHPALGQSNWAVSSINQIVEIDATSLDAIIDVSEIATMLGLEVSDLREWQRRFVLISLVDTYSGVCSFHISDTENSLGVSRAIAKYISTYGIPKKIKSDNGSAFVSKYIKEVLGRLGIDHSNTRAYAGWCKPYVERNFARLQNHLLEWVKGYIGHSVSQRQAIEFFFSRAQRRLRRGQKSNQTDLHTLQEMGAMIDDYAQGIMNNAYLERLGCTPCEAYNARSHEATRLHEYELASKLSPLEKRAVNKKGIAYGGLWYACPALYAHTQVYVALNINNAREIFVYDTNYQFIDVALNLDSEEITAEMAKSAQKIFNKELKSVKAKMQEARETIQTQTQQILKKRMKSMPKTLLPALQTINDANLKSAKAISEAQSQTTLNQLKEAQKITKENKECKKKDVSWEAAMKKKKISGA